MPVILCGRIADTRPDRETKERKTMMFISVSKKAKKHIPER